MKKLVSLIVLSIMIITLSVNVFATDSVLGDGTGNNTTTITGNEYENAQKNTANNNSALPQTGVEDYGVGILFVIFAAGAIFAYKKVSDYRDI